MLRVNALFEGVFEEPLVADSITDALLDSTAEFVAVGLLDRTATFVGVEGLLSSGGPASSL